MTAEVAASPKPPGRLQRGVAALVSKPYFWVAFVLLLVALPILHSVRVQLPPMRPVLGGVPSFEARDALGTSFGTAQLRGKAWLGAFFFTRCGEPCEPAAKAMSKIQHRMRNIGRAFQLVLLSGDAAYDTPERLIEYARGRRASAFLWKFVTTPPAEVRQAIAAAYRGSKPGVTAADEEALDKGGIFFLVDTIGRIRAFYPTPATAEAQDEVLSDAALVLNRGG